MKKNSKKARSEKAMNEYIKQYIQDQVYNLEDLTQIILTKPFGENFGEETIELRETADINARLSHLEGTVAMLSEEYLKKRGINADDYRQFMIDHGVDMASVEEKSKRQGKEKTNLDRVNELEEELLILCEKCERDYGCLMGFLKRAASGEYASDPQVVEDLKNISSTLKGRPVCFVCPLSDMIKIRTYRRRILSSGITSCITH
ncbi:MAG TPA: hypothetical protein P5098_00360 [Candidatus Dojkabacteria bacterium]|nr:hypothetical protein [Candidatus Dojkabacteria bacterium]